MGLGYVEGVTHNEANGENNRDGADDNASWNCGSEGPSVDSDVTDLRRRQIRNFLAVLLLSIGTPMLSMRDEVCRSQRGNNNPYCQDSELSWFDWSLLERHADIHRFTRELITLRFHSDVMIGARSLNLNDLLRQNKIEWHGVGVHEPDWGELSRSLAITISNRTGHVRFHVMVNAYWEALRFALPEPDGPKTQWRRWIDTSLTSPDDIVKWSAAPVVQDQHYKVAARSLTVLFVLLRVDEDTQS